MKHKDFKWHLLLLQLQTISNNRLMRMHYMQRWWLGQTYEWEVEVAYRDAGEPFRRAFMNEPRGLRIVSYRRKLMDNDNLVGGMKPLIDALKKTRLIFDDRPTMLFNNGIEQFYNKDAQWQKLWNTTVIYIGVLPEIKLGGG